MKRMSLIVATILASCGPAADEEAAEAEGGNPLNGPGSATHPAVSPDGTTLAFMSNMEGVASGTEINFEIYLSDRTGTQITRLTENQAFDADIAWAPSGEVIAYKSYADGNDEIYVVRRDGSGRRNLTSHPGSDFQPHWSPDGNRIVFGSDRLGTPGIFVLEVESGQVEVLLDTPDSEGSPRWSPDGSRMVFVSDRGGDDDVYVADSDGTGIRRLTSSPASDWSPRWSPDGTRVLFISGSFADDRWTLYSVEVDGSAAPKEIVDGVDSGNPAWHPSEDRIYFGRYVEGESRLFTARSDGSDLRAFGSR